jgi:hypothetical protein
MKLYKNWKMIALGVVFVGVIILVGLASQYFHQ